MQRTSLRGPSLAAKGRADESHSETSDKSYGLVVTFVKTQDLDCACVAGVMIPLMSVSWESPRRSHPLQDAVTVSSVGARSTEFGFWPWRQEVH